MNEQRQQAFLRLKPPCVNLSSVTLKFRMKEVPAKEVLRALEALRDVLDELGKANQLNPKLAEYAFFPLAQQVFNEAQRLSPRCLEVAAECVTLLVTYGYGKALQPELGKQLLILMSMLSGAGPATRTEKPTDELKIAAFGCIMAVVKALNSSDKGLSISDNQGAKTVADQLVYLMLEAIVDSPTEKVQIVASEALLELIIGIRSRVFLASLLPRTVSALVKALKPSTSTRRTQKALVSNLRLLRKMLNLTLSDSFAHAPLDPNETEILGDSWQKATATQVKNALIQVCKLRSHDSSMIHRALEELCVMVVEECQVTLADSIPVMLDTVVVLASFPDGESAQAVCRHFVITYPNMAEMLRTSIDNWTKSLPRIMQGQDERPKQMVLRKLSTAISLGLHSGLSINSLDQELVPLLIDGLSIMIEDTSSKAIELESEGSLVDSVFRSNSADRRVFGKFLLCHESQKQTTEQIQHLITAMRQGLESQNVTRDLIEAVARSDGRSQLASFWLALQFLRNDESQDFDLDNFFVVSSASKSLSSRSSILADLHAISFPLLSSVFDSRTDPVTPYHWQLQALALETLTLYAETFPSDSYRPELVDTLYPVLSFLASPNSILRSHAMTTLDKIAQYCQYASTQDLLVQNVDYLVNSIAWKLNTYSLAPEAPQLLRVMVLLCGAELIPYLDDLIQSIFAALDSYHGYPEWVEALFTSLRSMVDVSVKQPSLVITQGQDSVPSRVKSMQQVSNTNDILADLRARKRRKLDFDRSADEPPTSAPQRSWTNALDGPSFPQPTEATDEELNEQDNDESSLAPTKPPNEDEEKPLTKSHNLLLGIAKATVPHLASPSPQVRHLLLDLLKDISPLLSTDENTFLPLINAIWPVIIPRLFADQHANEEAAYNIAAAADTVATLCRSAGDFMSSRIEDIFQQLVRLFKSIRSQVKDAAVDSKPNTKASKPTTQSAAAISSSPLAGPVNLQVIPTSTQSLKSLDTTQLCGRHLTPTNAALRTSKSQILSSLIDLLLAILSHVRLTLDTGDEIMQLLLPLIRHKLKIRGVVETYNSDALWLWDFKEDYNRIQEKANKLSEGVEALGMKNQVEDVELRTPSLRTELRNRGFTLTDLVEVQAV